MATAPLEGEHDAALEERPAKADSEALEKVHKRALARFDAAVLPQLEQRRLSLEARRFATIPGAQWEGDWADPFDNAIKLEINKVGRGLDKIVRDYNENRIVPDFRPAGGKGDADTASTLDGLHRADSYRFKAQQARDNAFGEAAAGGFGAYRLTSEWEDPYDPDNEEQRINPGLIITDADQRVYFDPNSKLYDKSDAKFAFVVSGKIAVDFEEDHPDALTDWPDAKSPMSLYDWYSPEVKRVAEYYEVEEKADTLLVFTQRLSGEQQRWWKSDLAPGEMAALKLKGWSVKSRDSKRCRVHKYVMSGAEVLKDQGFIAGDRIPIVPVFGKRWYVDGQERFSGYVQDKIDSQRLYNSNVSRLAEVNAQSPREIPIFAAEQMPTHLQNLWARQIVDRHAYALVEPLRNGVGDIVSAGPIGKIDPPQLQPVTAALLQISGNDLVEDQQDGADQVKANVSADALEVAATRVDARSGIYLDNMRQSVQCEGDIYLGMADPVYFEDGRVVETMTEDGDDGTAVLKQPYTDKSGINRVRNDFRRGHYKVVASVTEATATRRDKTVKAALNTASVAAEIGDTELAQAAVLTAIANQDGEGMSDLQRYARQKGVASGLFEPTDDEKKQMEQAQQQQQPDPNAGLVAAKTADLAASAQLKSAQAQKAQADGAQSQAGTVLKLAQAHALGGPEEAPAVPDGLETAHKVAQISKTAAEAEHLRQTTAHLPQQLAIEGANAETKRMAVGKSLRERMMGMIAR